MTSGVERKLTTILPADAEGYSRAMAAEDPAPAPTSCPAPAPPDTVRGDPPIEASNG